MHPYLLVLWSKGPFLYINKKKYIKRWTYTMIPINFTCANDDFIGGQRPEGDGRLRKALLRQVGRVGQDDVEARVHAASAFTSELEEEVIVN